jgi:hypothetical protein
MALKSGQMAYLSVRTPVFDKAKEFLKSVSSGYQVGQFSYMPNSQVVGSGNQATTAVGLLCHQCMGMSRTDLPMLEGTNYLMSNQPSLDAHNLYYWYYATQVMHNQPGTEWDAWNRKMRKLLIETQCRDGCASGSWDPAVPKGDTWCMHGGRVMATSLAALTLEVYYRYLPLYKLDKPGGESPAQKKESEAPAEKKTSGSAEKKQLKAPAEKKSGKEASDKESDEDPGEIKLQ